MPEAYIVDAVRTPVGKRGGSLAGVHSADLGGHVLSALMRRTGVDPGAVDDVIAGCVDAIGPQAMIADVGPNATQQAAVIAASPSVLHRRLRQLRELPGSVHRQAVT